MSLALVGIFIIIFSVIKLTLQDPVGIIGLIIGIIVLLEVSYHDVWPTIRRNP